MRDVDGDTPLLVCEEPEVFQILIAAGADPATLNSAGEGILQKVYADENEKMVMFLMENHYVNDPNFKFTPGQFELQFNEVEGGEGNDDEEDGGEGALDAIHEGDEAAGDDTEINIRIIKNNKRGIASQFH